jgi:hypothetical protein
LLLQLLPAMNFLRFPHRILALAPLALALLLPARLVAAGDCCTAPDFTFRAVAGPARLLSPLAASKAPWMYRPIAGSPGARTRDGSRQFDYRYKRHLWLMGGVQTVPTGLPLTAETSAADRNAFSQAGLGVGYRLTPAVRAVTNWKTGLGQNSVSPGSQFTVGVALRY